MVMNITNEELICVTLVIGDDYGLHNMEIMLEIMMWFLDMEVVQPGD